MDQNDIEMLRRSLDMLATMSREVSDFYRGWHDQLKGIKPAYKDFKALVETLSEEVRMITKETKDWRAFQDMGEDVKSLLKAARSMEEIVTGPVVLVRVGEQLANLIGKIGKLGEMGLQESGTDEDHILGMLTPDQIGIVSKWVRENAEGSHG